MDEEDIDIDASDLLDSDDSDSPSGKSDDSDDSEEDEDDPLSGLDFDGMLNGDAPKVQILSKEDREATLNRSDIKGAAKKEPLKPSKIVDTEIDITDLLDDLD
jgi:hypothetical protein